MINHAVLEHLESAHDCKGEFRSASEDAAQPGWINLRAQGPRRRREGPVAAAGTAAWTQRGRRTFRLRDVDQAAEDLAHARLQGEVFGAAGHRDDQVGRFQVPVLGQQLVEGFRVRVAGQSDILWGRGEASGSAGVLLMVGLSPVYLLLREGERGAHCSRGASPWGSGRKAVEWRRVWVPLQGPPHPKPAGELGTLS